MTEDQKIRAEAAAFRGLVAHLQAHPDIQNIDLMTLAGFCRNCLSKWMVAGAAEQGAELDLEAAREMVYGMSYADWKDQHQTTATAEQKAAFEASSHRAAKIPGFLK